jgi:hypothetical protein
MCYAARGVSVMPINEKKPAPHIEGAVMIKQFAGSKQQRFSIQQQTDS